MKLWKYAAITLTLCGATLSMFFSRILLPPKPPLHFELSSFSSLSPSLSPLSSSPSPASSMSSNNSSGIGKKFRKVRSANGANSVISEFIHMFQTFTEGELKQIFATMVERKAQQWDSKQSKRKKRAKNRSKVCSLQEEEVTISQLGLAYFSDETIPFRYCSGRCMASRRNYDLTLASLKRKHVLNREDLKKAKHSPCCRPTAYEKEISFLDNQNRYHTIYEVSARECACV